GVSARATSEGTQRKRGTEQAESAESLLIGTRATDVGGGENHGKPACLPEKMGTKKRSYASAIIGDLAAPMTRTGWRFGPSGSASKRSPGDGSSSIGSFAWPLQNSWGRQGVRAGSSQAK